MLAKVSHFLVKPKVLDKLSRLSTVLFLASIFLIFYLPHLSESYNTVEKPIRNSSSFSNTLTANMYRSHLSEFIKQLKLHSDKEGFSQIKAIFSAIKVKSEVLSLSTEDDILVSTVHSIRGDKSRTLQINFLYDAGPQIDKNLQLAFNFLKLFEEEDNYHWLSKEIKFVLIPRKIYYQEPNSIFKLMTRHKAFLTSRSEFVFNLDFSHISLADITALLVNPSGMNGDSCNMDLVSETVANFKKTLIRKIEFKSNFFVNRDPAVLAGKLMDNVVESPQYTRQLFNMFNFFISNYFTFRKVNLSSLLISKGFNSIHIETKTKNKGEIVFDKKKTGVDFTILEALERLIKGFSYLEFKMERGDFNYMMVDTDRIIPLGKFILLPVILALQGLLLLIPLLIRVSEDKTTDKAKMTMIFVLATSVWLVVLIEIPNVFNVFQMFCDVPFTDFTFYCASVAVMGVLSSVLFSGMQTAEELDYLVLLNSMWYTVTGFTICFLNFGVGVSFGVLTCGVDTLSKRLTRRNKVCSLIKIAVPVGILVFSHFYFCSQLSAILFNFKHFQNNVFSLLAVLAVYLINETGIAVGELRTTRKLKAD